MLRMYRVANWFYRHKLKFIALLFQKLIHFIFCAQIPPSCIIGRNVVFCHGGMGVVLHPNVKIGDNCWIFQNVTIGEKLGSGNKEVPILGNNVIVCAGAVILGGYSFLIIVLLEPMLSFYRMFLRIASQ